MEKPILFSTEMVRAILAGRKTMTRRVIKPQPISHSEWGTMGFEWKHAAFTSSEFGKGMLRFCPYGQPGDTLWVRETWGWFPHYDCENENCMWQCQVRNGELGCFMYRASYDDSIAYEWNWKPSIHMSRKAARLFLKVTNVRVERLQDITEEDAIAEGIRGFTKDGALYKYGVNDDILHYWPDAPRTAKGGFARLWDSINAPRGYSWDQNPWVWAISFERTEV